MNYIVPLMMLGSVHQLIDQVRARSVPKGKIGRIGPTVKRDVNEER